VVPVMVRVDHDHAASGGQAVEQLGDGRHRLGAVERVEHEDRSCPSTTPAATGKPPATTLCSHTVSVSCSMVFSFSAGAGRPVSARALPRAYTTTISSGARVRRSMPSAVTVQVFSMRSRRGRETRTWARGEHHALFEEQIVGRDDGQLVELEAHAVADEAHLRRTVAHEPVLEPVTPPRPRAPPRRRPARHARAGAGGTAACARQRALVGRAKLLGQPAEREDPR